MHVYKFKQDPAVLLQEGTAIIQSNPEHRFFQRVVLVNLLLSDKISVPKLSEISGIPIRTLQGWLKTADEKGWDALRDGIHTGKPCRLSAADRAEIKRMLCEEDPQAYGYDTWGAKTLAAYIEKTYGIPFTQSGANKLLHRMGFVPVWSEGSSTPYWKLKP